jgi:hypothetical protein
LVVWLFSHSSSPENGLSELTPQALYTLLRGPEWPINSSTLVPLNNPAPV